MGKVKICYMCQFWDYDYEGTSGSHCSADIKGPISLISGRKDYVPTRCFDRRYKGLCGEEGKFFEEVKDKEQRLEYLNRISPL